MNASEHGLHVDRSGQEVARLAEKLKARCVIFLRQTEIGDRRRHDRLPCDLSITLAGPCAPITGRTADISEGGALMRPDGDHSPIMGSTVEARIAGIGLAQVRLVNRSQLGLHLKFGELARDVRAALDAKLRSIRGDNKEFIERAIATAARISNLFEDKLRSGAITYDALFDNEYVPIEQSNPLQHRTRSLDWLESVLPAIQEPLFASDDRMVFCAAIDRNAYLPVHNKIYSHPQRLGDVAWNTAHSRNRRIFDDRAGLSAARNARPYLIQNYPRDMGNGITIMMQEIDAPIRVSGKHWGGFRTAYKL